MRPLRTIWTQCEVACFTQNGRLQERNIEEANGVSIMNPIGTELNVIIREAGATHRLRCLLRMSQALLSRRRFQQFADEAPFL